MDQIRKFNEISITYNNCVAHLEMARQIFQGQLTELINCVEERLNDKASENGFFRHKWDKIENSSSGRDGAWLNFYSMIKVRLSVKPANYNTFRTAAFLYFEGKFDEDLGRFMLQCRLENQNTVNDQIDEEIIRIIKNNSSEEEFPRNGIVKTDRAILFKIDVDEQLFDNLNKHVDSAITICNKAIENLFPEENFIPLVNKEGDEAD